MRQNLDPVALTRHLLSFNTISPPGNERECVEYLGKLLEDGGFETDCYEFSEGRPSLIAKMAGSNGKAPICFSGHIDVMSLGAAEWSKDPFKGEIDGDKLYGRGSSDMKSGIAAMVVAALRLAEMSHGKAGITMVITAGEETGCEGAFYLAELGDVLGNAGAIVIGEPTSNYPCVGHKGVLWLEASTTGITAHGSMPEQGVNAIYKAAEVVSKLEKYNFDVSPHPYLGSPTLNVGTISGGMNVNAVPDKAVIGIDIRTIPDQSNDRVYEALQSSLGEEVALKRIQDVGGVNTDSQNEWVQQVFGIMENILPERPIARGISYFTDASALTPAFGNPPTIILGPGEPTMAHKTDEFCHISRIQTATEAYLQIARAWYGSS